MPPSIMWIEYDEVNSAAVHYCADAYQAPETITMEANMRNLP
jgi:hypothetical protein